MAITTGNSFVTFLRDDIAAAGNFTPAMELLPLNVAAIEEQLRVAIDYAGATDTAALEFVEDAVALDEDDVIQFTGEVGQWTWAASLGENAVYFHPDQWLDNDRMVIWRETRTDRLWAFPTKVARAHGRDLMNYWNQLRLAIQDVRELETVGDFLGQPPTEVFDPPYIGRSQADYTAAIGKTKFSYFDIELMRGVGGYPDHPGRQLVVAVDSGGVFVDQEEDVDYELNIVTENVEFFIAPNAAVRIRRQTKIDSMWVQLPDGYAFNSKTIHLNQRQIRFLKEEGGAVPPPLFADLDLLNNPIHQRGWNYLNYLGIDGRVLVFGGASWGGDGETLIIINEVLEEDVEFDPINFRLTLPDGLADDDVIQVQQITNIIYMFEANDANTPIDPAEDEGPAFNEPQDGGGEGDPITVTIDAAQIFRRGLNIVTGILASGDTPLGGEAVVGRTQNQGGSTYRDWLGICSFPNIPGQLDWLPGATIVSAIWTVKVLALPVAALSVTVLAEGQPFVDTSQPYVPQLLANQLASTVYSGGWIIGNVSIDITALAQAAADDGQFPNLFLAIFSEPFPGTEDLFVRLESTIPRSTGTFTYIPA